MTEHDGVERSTATDELRAMAESVGLAMPQAATLMMGAADAIDRLDAENAKLRELLHEALLFGDERSYQEVVYGLKQQARELGVEVGDGTE